MSKFKAQIINTTDDPVGAEAIQEIRHQLMDTKIIARRAAKRWSLNETGGGSVPH